MGYNIEEILNTPTIIIEETIDKMNSSLNGVEIGNEFTTPFHMLLEGSRSLSKDSLLGTESIIRRKFPSLAKTPDDIYLQIHTEVKDNIFAIAGTAPIVFYVNVMELKQYGVYENNNYTMTIPSGTTIEVRGVMFTLLNDINVSLSKNGITTVEQINNDLDIAVNDIGILNSNLYSDAETVDWLVFETVVKNISKTTIEIPITVGSNFIKSIPLTNKFSTIEVSYSDNDIVTPMVITYSDTYLDESKPTAVITLTNNTVNVMIPEIYLNNKEIDGILIIDVYETNGELYLPLNQLALEDYVLTLKNTGKTEYTAVSSNITMVTGSRGVLSNGVNSMEFDELRNAIIDSTLGDIDLPITDLQIKRKAKMLGYDLSLVKDTLFSRLYIANKSLPEPESALVTTKPDIFFNRTTIDLNSDLNNDYLKMYKDIFVINNNALFRYDNNGNIRLLSNIDNEAFNLLSKSNKIEYLKTNKLFYTPYSYVVKYDENVTYTEVYYLKPDMDNIRILKKNFNVLPKVNTKQFSITKTLKGYQILSNIAYNEELSKTDMSKLKARIVFDLADSSSKLYFDASYDVLSGLFTFDIETGYLYNNLIDLVNGESLLVDRAVNLNTKANIYLYSTDENIVDSEKFLLTEFGKSLDYNISILTKESIDINFGIKLDYLYNTMYTMYNSKKYKKYTYDLPLVYTDDVYEINNNGLIFNANVSPSGRVNLTGKLLHKKGDPVLDIDGNVVYKYRKGDTILENGIPVIDTIGGIKRILNIMMLEYEFKLAETDTYKKYNELFMDIITSMVYTDMTNLNSITLENTRIKYKSYRSLEDVSINVNNVTYLMPYGINPEIILYINSDNVITSSVTIEDYKSTCGKILSKHLDNNTIVLKNIKEEIISTLGNTIKAVGISGIDSNNSEVINISGINRFIINKKLEVNEANLFTVKYDLNLKIQYV